MSQRFGFAVFLAVLCLGVLRPPAWAADFTADQKKAIEGIVRDYLKAHPEVVVDAMQAAEDKIKAEAKDKAAQALNAHRRDVFDDPESPIAGNPKGDVTLVEFFTIAAPIANRSSRRSKG